jgi:NAD(P)-dependent dehydrogenase (short-subunit alcohol dehydrogenase family)
MKIKDSAVLVTGASRGLGAALARELSARGARVGLVARDGEMLERVVLEIRKAGGDAHAIAADVARPESAARIAGMAAALIGPVDVLIHNASSLGPVPLAPLADIDDQAFEEALATNLAGPFRLTRALVGSMALRGHGLVVHITSDAATNAYPRWGAYGASKAALEHLGRIWAAELADTGVVFLNIDPGEMATKMHRDAMPDVALETLAGPETAANRIVTLLATELPPSGARIEVTS